MEFFQTFNDSFSSFAKALAEKVDFFSFLTKTVPIFGIDFSVLTLIVLGVMVLALLIYIISVACSVSSIKKKARSKKTDAVVTPTAGFVPTAKTVSDEDGIPVTLSDRRTKAVVVDSDDIQKASATVSDEEELVEIAKK